MCKGRKIPGIVDNDGRILHPDPYHIPQDPHKIIQFSVWMSEAAIDSGFISAEHLDRGEEDLRVLRRLLIELNSTIPFLSGVKMESQPQP